MATTANKQKVLDHVYAALKKRFDVPDPAERSVSEHLLYAVVREGTTREKADKAFANLKARFVDWNEVRVSTVQELCDAMGPLPDVAVRAQRLISLLQEWFELTYTFDMDEIAKKGLKEGAKKISRLDAANDYAVAWVMLHGLGGHAIPLDGPSLRVLRRLGVLDGESESLESLRGTIEHFVPKAKGATFVELLSQHADAICTEDNPKCPKCPLLDDCPTGQELMRVQEAPKPRKSR
jgi:endonuclease III